MGLLATSPLLSTQFILWLIGGVAVAASVPGPDGGVARRSLPAVAVLVLLTHLVFPVQWFGLVTDGVLPAATLLARNGLLLALTAWLFVSVRGSAEADPPRTPGRALGRAPRSEVPASAAPSAGAARPASTRSGPVTSAGRAPRPVAPAAGSAVRSQVHADRTHARPGLAEAPPERLVAQEPVDRTHAAASRSVASTSSPVRSCSTASAVPPARPETTGSPAAAASSSTMPRDSVTSPPSRSATGSTNRSAAA